MGKGGNRLDLIIMEDRSDVFGYTAMMKARGYLRDEETGKWYHPNTRDENG